MHYRPGNVHTFLFWRHDVTTPSFHHNRMELERMYLAQETDLDLYRKLSSKKIPKNPVNSTQPKVQEEPLKKIIFFHVPLPLKIKGAAKRV